MTRWKKIYRGDTLIGYAGLDNGLKPCNPFEVADGFAEVKHLFRKEQELEMLLDNADLSDEQKLEIVDACDAVMEQILAPGVKVTTLDDIYCFDCILLVIFDWRVCWR